MSHCTKPKCKNMVEPNSIFKRCDHCREFVSKSTKKYRDNHPEIRLKNNEYAKQYYQKKILKNLECEILPVDKIKNI